MPQHETEEDMQLISIKEACGITGHTPNAIRQLLWKGRPTPWPIYKDPATGRHRVKRADVRKYRERLERECRVDAGAEAVK